MALRAPDRCTSCTPSHQPCIQLFNLSSSLTNILVYGEGGGSVNGVAVDIEVEIGVRSGVNGSAG